MKSAHHRAFTLVEMLVVIGIIAIVAAILFPVFALVRESARQTTCLSNVRQIALASILYAQDHDDILPPYVNNRPGALCRLSGDLERACNPEALHSCLLAYIRNDRIWFCPSDPAAGEDAEWDVYHGLSSYGFSFLSGPYVLMLNGEFFHYYPANRRNWGLPRLTPSEVFIVADSQRNGAQGGRMHRNGSNVAYLDGHARFYPNGTRAPESRQE